jgi:hypothetical protein
LSYGSKQNDERQQFHKYLRQFSFKPEQDYQLKKTVSNEVSEFADVCPRHHSSLELISHHVFFRVFEASTDTHLLLFHSKMRKQKNFWQQEAVAVIIRTTL